MFGAAGAGAGEGGVRGRVEGEGGAADEGGCKAPGDADEEEAENPI